jgi:hypothetical protein
MPKMNLYVPDELWEATQQRKEVNWSQVFQRAVKEELGQPVKRRGPPTGQPDLDALVDVEAVRLRFTQQRDELYRRGYEVGIHFAHEADYVLMCHFEGLNWDPWKIRHWLIGDDGLDSRLVMSPVGELKPTDEPPRNILDRLKDALISAEAADLVVAEGFADALRRVWERVMQQPVINTSPHPPQAATEDEQ